MEKVVTITKHNKQNDFAYWKNKSIEERLNAIEFLRQQFSDYENQLSKGLQRVCRVIRKEQS